MLLVTKSIAQMRGSEAAMVRGETLRTVKWTATYDESLHPAGGVLINSII